MWERRRERRLLSQAGKRGDEAGRRPPVEYGVMQFALTRTRLGGWGASAREGEAAAERGRSRPGVEAAEGTGRQAPSDSDKLLLENGNKCIQTNTSSLNLQVPSTLLFMRWLPQIF